MTFATVLLAAVLVAPFSAQVANGAITAYIPFDVDKNDTTGNLHYDFDNPYVVTHANVVAGAGQPGFGGALAHSGRSANWCGFGTCPPHGMNKVTGPVGTMEFWISPNWAGTAAGGPGVGGSGVFEDITHFGGHSVDATKGVNVGIYNNNYPNDGGQLFVAIRDTDGANKLLESNYHGSGHELGTTKYWEAGSWHHIAVTWDGSTYTSWMDGDRIQQVAAGTGIDWPNDMWISGWGNANSVFNGYIDDLVFRDNVQYDPSQTTYDVPTRVGTFVAPEPATLSMLGIGGLGLLRRRR